MFCIWGQVRDWKTPFPHTTIGYEAVQSARAIGFIWLTELALQMPAHNALHGSPLQLVSGRVRSMCASPVYPPMMVAVQHRWMPVSQQACVETAVWCAVGRLIIVSACRRVGVDAFKGTRSRVKRQLCLDEAGAGVGQQRGPASS
jgi:hypothetical protein